MKGRRKPRKTGCPPSGSESAVEASAGFGRLAGGVRRWVWKQGWPSLREIQEMALVPVLEGKEDVILSAATAGGKTEAAFLPACTRMAESQLPGIAVLYISPLKALINDQARRLESLCGSVGFPVTPWHGDAPEGGKNALRKDPRGVLLITPESLESLLMNSSRWCEEAFGGLVDVIVDEFHAFLGTERGCQLQSLLRRIEFLIGRTVPRIALSATLSKMEIAALALRPEKTLPCRILVSEGKGSELLLQVRGYRVPVSGKEGRPPLPEELVQDIYRLLRGESHLVFANSRARTEELAAALSALCGKNFVPNEFFPHHGSLAPELRRGLEERLQKKELPTTAVCTSTLELGIDIGSVASIAQVGEPSTVSGLRQRLGRSGRRGGPAVLRVFVEEPETGPDSHPADFLRLSLVQSAAVLSLLLRKWREPPREGLYHLSTLVQQTLSVIAQYGGVRADQLWKLLCGTGPFSMVGRNDYAEFLRGLAEKHAITQLEDGRLVLGTEGELMTDRYTFFTAFASPEEYRLEYNGALLGTVPLEVPLVPGQRIVFAGRAWEAATVLPESKTILLRPSGGGSPPRLAGGTAMVHDAVRREMKQVFLAGDPPPYFDRTAAALFREGAERFRASGLGETGILEGKGCLHLFPWRGDEIVEAAAMLLRGKNLEADTFAGVITVSGISRAGLRAAVGRILGGPLPQGKDLAAEVPDTEIEKFDSLVPRKLRERGWAARYLDVPGAAEWLTGLAEQK